VNFKRKVKTSDKKLTIANGNRMLDFMHKSETVVPKGCESFKTYPILSRLC